MKRVQENIKEFGNGNLSIRVPVEHRPWLTTGMEYATIRIGEILDELDCYFVGEEFCLSNHSMGRMIYNAHSDLVYVIYYSDILNVLARGNWLRLYAVTPGANEREIINEWMGV